MAMTQSSSTNFKSLVLKPLPTSSTKRTPEAIYWSKYKVHRELSQTSPIYSLEISPTSPNLAVFASGARVNFYDLSTDVITKSITRFNDQIYSAKFRLDGKLLVAAGIHPEVLILDVNTRATLRALSGHSRPIHSVEFSEDNVHVLSCSDDTTARYWDVATGSPLLLFGQHSDHVRSCSRHPLSSAVWATGSYDHTVKLWDIRASHASQSACTMTLSHGAPVEACRILPGGSLLMSAGGNYIKIWDILGGGKLLHTSSNHQKTITRIALDDTNSRFLTASLDGHVKVCDIKTYEVIHGFKTTSGVLSIAVSALNSHVLIGSADGNVSIRHRQVRNMEANQLQLRKSILQGGYRYFVQNQRHDDVAIVTQRHKRIAPYDRALRKFDYKLALDEALRTRSPLIVTSLLEELRLRQGLKRAIVGRNEESLKPLMHFLVKHVTDPNFPTLVDTSLLVCELYSMQLGQSSATDKMFLSLYKRVNSELSSQEQFLELSGMLENVISSVS